MWLVLDKNHDGKVTVDEFVTGVTAAGKEKNLDQRLDCAFEM
jgi:Ca2+-binding EF-hand superfamily protein